MTNKGTTRTTTPSARAHTAPRPGLLRLNKHSSRNHHRRHHHHHHNNNNNHNNNRSAGQRRRPGSFVAHVHFKSRVRITGGPRRPRGNPSLGDSSDSDSPSSSISAPLRYRSRDTVSRAPLVKRVSHFATHALQRRRPAPGAPAPPTQRLRARVHEYTPLFRAGAPVAYGAAVHRDSGGDDEGRSRVVGSHDEDEVVFGRWPWRALNRRWCTRQIKSTLCCGCPDESDADE
ncbi:hypothetical protein F5148DRAFT_973776 [Russula earlei]|uniref:Uncharacterized protein n=1 Tax=Russula earlei TaxID=71964 RepID=A0ACC0UMH5_9AGAM|nr:hypothetical protein F5148DRAFT_973776 [Russula earlei]